MPNQIINIILIDFLWPTKICLILRRRLFINKNRQVNHNQNDAKDMVKYVKKDQNILLDGWGIIKITGREL